MNLFSTVFQRVCHATTHAMYIVGPAFFEGLKTEVDDLTQDTSQSKFIPHIGKVIWGVMGISFLSESNKIWEEKNAGARAYKMSNHFAQYGVYTLEALTTLMLIKNEVKILPCLAVFVGVDLIPRGNSGPLIDELQEGITALICSSKIFGECAYPVDHHA